MKVYGTRGAIVIQENVNDHSPDVSQEKIDSTILSYRDMVKVANGLMIPESEGYKTTEESEYLRGMVELIAYSHSMNSDDTDTIQDDIMNPYELKAVKLITSTLGLRLEDVRGNADMADTLRTYAELVTAAQTQIQAGIYGKTWAWKQEDGYEYGDIEYNDEIDDDDYPNPIKSFHGGFIETLESWLTLRLGTSFAGGKLPALSYESIRDDIFSVFV